MSRVSFQSLQERDRSDQKNRSARRSLGRRTCRFKTATCCRRARFSRASSERSLRAVGIEDNRRNITRIMTAVSGMRSWKVNHFNAARVLASDIRSLHRITVFGFTRIHSDLQSFQSLESNDQKRRSLFRSRGFFDLRLYTTSCCRNARIRTHAARFNHPKITRLSR